jgi:hypothetical protein
VPRENPRAHLAQILLEALRAVSAKGNGGRAGTLHGTPGPRA